MESGSDKGIEYVKISFYQDTKLPFSQLTSDFHWSFREIPTSSRYSELNPKLDADDEKGA